MNLEIGETDRTADRIQRWFRRPDHEQLKRELNLRLEERRQERARIARELHDTVDRVPADSPSKPSLSRALRLIQRVLEEGRIAVQGLRSSEIASMSLEQALCGV